jgi:hypothetical protein
VFVSLKWLVFLAFVVGVAAAAVVVAAVAVEAEDYVADTLHQTVRNRPFPVHLQPLLLVRTACSKKAAINEAAVES